MSGVFDGEYTLVWDKWWSQMLLDWQQKEPTDTGPLCLLQLIPITSSLYLVCSTFPTAEKSLLPAKPRHWCHHSGTNKPCFSFSAQRVTCQVWLSESVEWQERKEGPVDVKFSIEGETASAEWDRFFQTQNSKDGCNVCLFPLIQPELQLGWILCLPSWLILVTNLCGGKQIKLLCH